MGLLSKNCTAKRIDELVLRKKMLLQTMYACYLKDVTLQFAILTSLKPLEMLSCFN